jgi:hypothetical protein
LAPCSLLAQIYMTCNFVRQRHVPYWHRYTWLCSLHVCTWMYAPMLAFAFLFLEFDSRIVMNRGKNWTSRDGDRAI